jgi:hypothetical protein
MNNPNLESFHHWMSFSESNSEESATACAKELCVMIITDRIKIDLFMDLKITAFSVVPGSQMLQLTVLDLAFD